MSKAFSLFLLAGFLAAMNPGRAGDALKLFGGEGGSLLFVAGEDTVCTLAPALADSTWQFTPAHATTPASGAAAPGAPFPYQIGTGNLIEGELQVAAKDNGVEATWNFTAKNAVEFETLAMTSDFTLSQLAGGQWTAGEATGTFPAHLTSPHLFGGEVSSLALALPGKGSLTFTFPKPTYVVLQDNRQWGSATFTLRIGRSHGQMTAGETFSIAMTITSSNGLPYSRELPDFMKPVTLQADDQWVPLTDDLDIVPGSALDLSSMGFTDGPCGAKGRIVATPDGHFVCANEPGKPKRFYGVNLCFDASYLAKDEADRLLDRLVRLGYNAVRIHHYEAQLTTPVHHPGFEWDPAKVDELDYLMAGCARRGVWITTDLFVSRPVSFRQIGLPGDGNVPMDQYKILVPVYEPAYQDWATFARKFLDRVNPYTGKRVADDPALAWISLVNEGPVSSNWSAARAIPAWKVAWNKWLAARYAARADLAAAIGDVGANEDPGQGTVALPELLDTATRRGALGQVFAAATEKAAYERMRDFLRDDIKCPALLTNMNDSGSEVMPLEGTRSDFDYVDEHFYVDHPRFLAKHWQLPSECSNVNPVANGAPGGAWVATIRLFNKPFTVTEFNYAGPSRYRGVGGVLTGAMAGLQDWAALWRFDYCGDKRTLFAPARMGYFDGVTDPLNQAADRLAVLLFLRGDVEAAPNRLAMSIPRKTLDEPTERMSLSGMQQAVWRTRVGGLVVDDPADEPVPASNLPAPTQPGDPIRSETGEITIDPGNAVLTIDTPRSAGGYADAGKAIDSPKAGVRVDGVTNGATVFVDSLDGAPISSSRRLLVTHLTDLQNSGARFGEAAHRTLLDWGGLPHLVRDGAATVHVTLADPTAYSVWALSMGGKRLDKMETKIDGGQLVFTARVRGPDGARMLYEIAQ